VAALLLWRYPLPIGPDVVSELRRADADEVEALLLAAFPGPEEAALVRALRAEGAMVAEWVMRWQGRIGAYAGISRMVAPAGWFALAPVAVLPEWQNGALAADRPGLQNHFRFGSRIVRQAASLFVDHADLLRKTWALDAAPTLVVVGKPSFYARCGFSAKRAARLRSPWPAANTLIAREGQDIPEERLVYPRAFDGL
jgi:putative acetyltransferase